MTRISVSAGKAALFAAFAFTGCGTALLGPVLPALSAHLHLTDVQSGRLFTAQFLGAFAAALCASTAVSRIGMRRTALSALAAIALGFAACAVAPASVLPVPVLVYGAGLGLAIPVISLMVAAVAAGGSAPALNLLNFAWCAGALAVPSMASAILSRGSVPALFAGFSAAALLLAIAMRVTVPPETLPPAKAARTLIQRRHLKLAAQTSLLLFLYVGVESSLAGWTPTWAARAGAAIYARGVPASCFWAGILAARLIAPAALRHVAPSTAILAGILLNGVALTVMFSFQSFPALMAGSGLAGLGLGAIFPTAVAMFCDDVGPEAARSFNFVFASGALGGAAIPLATGWLTSQSHGLRAGLLPAAFCTLLMFGIELLWYRSATNSTPPARE